MDADVNAAPNGKEEEQPLSEAASTTKNVRSLTVPIVTALVLIALFCAYYFVYVRARREYIAKRNFRALAVLGTQIQRSIDIHSTVLEKFAYQSDETQPGAHSHQKPQLKQFFSKRNGGVGDQEARFAYLNYLAPNFQLEDVSKQTTQITGMQVRRRNGAWELVLAEPRSGNDYIGSIKISDLLEPFVGTLPFDDILLASQTGAMIYQKAIAGPQFTTLSSLLQNQIPDQTNKPESDSGSETQQKSIQVNADKSWQARSVHLTEVTLAGTNYKLFLQPVLVDTGVDLKNLGDTPKEWVLCGLISSKALEWEALAISYTAVIWITALFLATCLAGPILKVFLLNQWERFKARELSLIGLCLVLLSCVCTLSSMQAIYYHIIADRTDEQLAHLAQNLSSNMYTEIWQMRRQLQSMCSASELKDDLMAAGKREVVRKNSPRFNADDPVTPVASEYPYFNNVFWTDFDGHQIVKWSTSSYVTPMIDISQLPSYRHLMEAEERSLFYLNGQGPPFIFDSIIPPNKLEYLAVLGMKTCSCNPRLCGRNSGLDDDVTQGLAFLVAQPFSMIDPILPYGYGFAVVDNSGDVLFHTDKTRNTLENFSQEAESNKELYAAMFGHSTPRGINITYMGKDYRARVVPIRGLAQAPWSLVVYRDLTFVRTLNLQTMTMSSTLFLMILAIPIGMLVIWRWSCRPRFVAEWLWPHKGRIATYVYQILLYAVLSVLLLLIAAVGSSEEILIACAAIPYTALAFTWWAFRIFPFSAEKQQARRSAKGADPRRQTTKELAGSSGGALDTATVLRVFPRSFDTFAGTMLSALGALCLLIAIVVYWPHLKSLILLPAVWVLATAPLWRRPRVLLMSWLRTRRARNLALTHKSYYAGSMLLFLLLLGVLTPLVLFRNSLGVEGRLYIKEAQLHLASRLEHERAVLRAQCEAGERSLDECRENGMVDGKNAPNLWSRASLIPLIGTSNFASHSEEKTTELYSAWFQRLIYQLHHNYNLPAAEMSGVIADRGSPKTGALEPAQPSKEVPEWSWMNSNPDKITLLKHGSEPDLLGGDKDADLLLETPIRGTSFRDLLIAIVVGSGVTIFMTGLFWAIARRVFLFQIVPHRIAGARQAAQSIREGRNVVILVPPASDWKPDEPGWVLDLSEIAIGPKWAELLDLNTIPINKLIEIRGFEHPTDDPEIHNQKFVLLKRLIARPNTQMAVIIVVPVSMEEYSRIFPDFEVIDLREEPLLWMAAYEGPAAKQIWKECEPMPVLWPLGAQVAKDIRMERELEPTISYTDDGIAVEILEKAEPYYRMIWRDCSTQQKFVLSQLASDGVPNPRNERALQQLVRRGLILKDPQFRIVNESFRRFLLTAPTREQKTRWARESRKTGWGKAHGAFFAVLFVLGAFLLTTQNQLWQSSAAYVTTAFGALGTLAKIFNTFRSGSSGDKPG